MNIRKPLLLGATISALVASMALPAAAGPTVTTFELTGGDLTLSVAATATLDEADTGDTAITGSLGAVSVTDERGTTAEWAASAGSTAFTGALAGEGSTSTAVSYSAGAVTTGGPGTITVADGIATALPASGVEVVAPTEISGNNTASWTPTLDVTMPGSALADTYTGTVTTSVL